MRLVIGILTLNRIDYLARCIASIIKAYPTYFKTKIIISDAGSNDASSVSHLINRLRFNCKLLTTNKRLSVAENNNKILWFAHENYNPDLTILMNDDIIVFPGVFEAYVEATQFSQIDHFCFTDEKSPWKIIEEYNLNDVRISRRIRGDGVLMTITRSMLQTIGGFDESFRAGEHYEYTHRAEKFGFCKGAMDIITPAPVAKAVQYYQQIPRTLSTTDLVEGNKRWIEYLSHEN